ncbi:MAG: DUF3883 domain-containing protein [Ruminococcaceae bacterium]|nr:DUF3883 domain-containing protein [Oscillospiraceae bacterium]
MILCYKSVECEYIDKLTKEYIDNHIREQERELLIIENTIEERDVKGYHGREILELLQNADDAYQKSMDMGKKPNCALEVFIEYKNNILSITNTGTLFDNDGIKAIVEGNNSPKKGKYIGNKGTGFRSILNWANKIRIFSGNFGVEFSKEIANKCFEKIRNESQIQKQLKKKSNLYIPMLAVPINIENTKNPDRTTIEILIDQQKNKDDFSVLKQIENIDLRILMFLPNINQIDITTENSHIVYKRTINSETTKKLKNDVRLQKIVDGKIEVEESFFLFRKLKEKAIKEDDAFKDISLSIAVPKDFDNFNSKYIYSFFPLLNTESPFKCIFHATYALGDHRNTINKSETNKKIIKEQIDFLIEIANEFVEIDNYEIAYNILIPTNFSKNNWSFTSPFKDLELEDYYFERLTSQKIFPTVNNKNISVKDKPKALKKNYPNLFVGEAFENLLKSLPDEALNFIEILAAHEKLEIDFEEEELTTAINSMTEQWNVSQQIEVFIWWNKNYKKFLPNLLKTQDDNWFKFNEECFFLIGKFDYSLPVWAKIPALNKNYQQELFLQTGKSPEIIEIREKDSEAQIHRIISQHRIYPTIDFKYRDRNNIISNINSSVDSYEKAIDFVKWLWKNYQNDDNWTPPGRSGSTSIKYNFPSQKGSFIDSNSLYLGSGYNNPLAEKLFDDSYAAFPSIEAFGIDDVEEFANFICKFGVKRFPEIKIQKISKPINTYYNKYKKEIESYEDLNTSNYTEFSFFLPYINNIETLLEKLTTSDILDWIIQDSQLYKYLHFKDCLDLDAKIEYRGSRQQYTRKYQKHIDNYLLEIFNTTKWIEIGDKRYSPNRILQSFNSKTNQKFTDLIPIINTDILEKIAEELKVSYGDIKNIFELFNFCNIITDLSSEDFYGLMLKLSYQDPKQSADIFKTIYRIVEQVAFSKEFEDSKNKIKFFEEGKVLVKYQGVLQYYPAKESYLPSTKIINKDSIPIVDKGQRTNNSNFIKIFGCQEYTDEYKVENSTIVESKANDSFQKYFNIFKQFANAYAEKNNNIDRYGNSLNIILVDKICVKNKESGIITEIKDDYLLISDTTTKWYITVFNTNFDIKKISLLIENIYSTIANTPGFDSGKIGELFRTNDPSDREFLIKKEFGSLDVIQSTTYENEIKNNFIKTLDNLNAVYSPNDIEIIDFSNFDNIKNASSIINLFKKIDTDVDLFKKAGFVYIIDLVPYFKHQLSEFICKERSKFKNFIFTNAIKDKSKQNVFLKTIDKFVNFNIQEYVNSVYFDIEKKIVAEFGEWRNTDESTILHADEIYTNNYHYMNPDNRFKDEISNNEKVKLMIYFNKTEEFSKWLEIQKEKVVEENPDLYSRYKDIIPYEEKITYNNNLNIYDNSINSNKIYNHGGSFTATADEKRRKRQKVLGNKGELLIYNLLCESVGEQNVTPKSEAFVELDYIPAGLSVSGEYDISYKDKNGNEKYVEVKTGDASSFFMSPGELQFAKEHAEQYELYIVYNIDAKNPKYIKLPKMFWSDKKFRRNDIVEKIKFEF